MTSNWIRSWFGLHLVSLAAILLQPSTPALILGRYSRTSALILGAFLVASPLVWAGTRWLAGRVDRLTLKTWQYAAVSLTASGLLFGLWAAPIGQTSSYLIVRLYLTFILFTALIWALQHLVFPAWTANLPWLLGVGACALLLILSTRFPGLLWTDEGFMLSGALGFVHKGYPQVSLFEPARLEGYSLAYMGLGGWLSVFGVSVGSGRTFIFVLGLVSLAFSYAAVRNAYSSFTAWLAVILGAFALLINNYLRADIGVAVALAIAFCCFALAQKKGWDWPHLLVGFAVGFGLDGHPNAYRFGLAFGIAYLLDYGLLVRERRRFFVYRPFFYLVAGGLMGFGAYFALYATITERFLIYARAPFWSFDLLAAPAVLLEQFNSALRLAPALFGAAALGVVVALRRRNALDRLLLVVVVVSPLTLAVLYSYYRDYYLVHLLPTLVLLAAGLFWELEKAIPRHAQGAFVLAATLLCLGLLTQALGAAGSQSYAQALAVADRLREIVPRESVLVGIDPFYSRLYDYPTFIDVNTGVVFGQQVGIDERAAWEQIAPTAVAVVHGYPIPPPPALLDYIDARALTLVRCWSTDRLGRVELYMEEIPDGVVVSSTCEVLDGASE